MESKELFEIKNRLVQMAHGDNLTISSEGHYHIVVHCLYDTYIIFTMGIYDGYMTFEGTFYKSSMITCMAMIKSIIESA